jgi:hypothetical protein
MPGAASGLDAAGAGIKSLGTKEGFNTFMGNAATKTAEATGMGGASGLMKTGLAAAAPTLMATPETVAPTTDITPHNFTFDYGQVEDPQMGYDGAYTGERTYFTPRFTRRAADGGMMDSGPIEAMSDRNQYETMMANGGQMFAEGGETKAVKPVEQDPYYTMSGQSGDAFKYLMGQAPAPRSAAPAVPSGASGSGGFLGGTLGGVTGFASPEGIVDASTGRVTPWSASNPKPTGGGFFGNSAAQRAGEGASSNFSFDLNTGMFTRLPPTKPVAAAVEAAPSYMSEGKEGGLMSLARGGVSHLGDYSDGGRLLKGPGDGVSDSIPATIANKRPARLADGEFVVPARIVSELGNGSTEAGARKLYAMMDRVQKARGKTTGKDRVAVNSRAEKLLPA